MERITAIDSIIDYLRLIENPYNRKRIKEYITWLRAERDVVHGLITDEKNEKERSLRIATAREILDYVSNNKPCNMSLEEQIEYGSVVEAFFNTYLMTCQKNLADITSKQSKV